MSLTPYMAGAEPYFCAGGPVGCLVLHGFTASPAEVRWLAEYLAGQGYTVYAPRLTGHGTSPEDLARTRWRDWYASALDGYHLLRERCEKVVIVGHSMGGLLTLLLASEQPVAGAAVLAAPMHLSLLARMSPYIYPFYPYSDQSDQTDLPERIREEQAARGETVLGRVRYDRWPTRSVAELWRLINIVKGRLPLVTVPLLLMYAERDPLALIAHGEQVMRGVSSTDVEWQSLTRCAHIVTQDTERETVFSEVAKFIARLG